MITITLFNDNFTWIFLIVSMLVKENSIKRVTATFYGNNENTSNHTTGPMLGGIVMRLVYTKTLHFSWTKHCSIVLALDNTKLISSSVAVSLMFSVRLIAEVGH